MPRRSNAGPQNAAARREIRIDVISRHQNLRNKIRNVSNLLRRNNVSNIAKTNAKIELAQMAIRIFSRNNVPRALPYTTSKIVEKMINAWPHAVQRAGRARTPARSAARQASPKRYSATVSPFRNAKLAVGPNGKPIVVYFPNN